MEYVPMNLEPRDTIGSGKVNRARHEGYIPGVIYGMGMEATPVQIKGSVLSDNIRHHGQNTIYNIELNHQTMQAVIRDLQVDRLKHEYVHVDLQRISLDQKREAQVPIRITGKSMAKTRGGVFNIQMENIIVEGLPADIPEYIEINVSDMQIGDHFTVGDLDFPDNLVMKNSPKELIVSLSPARSVEEDLNTKDDTPANAVPIIGNDERETNAT